MPSAASVRWRIPAPPRLRFRFGMQTAVALPAEGPLPLAVVIGPKGDRGPAGPAYDQTSPNDGIAIVGDSLRVDIASLPLAD